MLNKFLSNHKSDQNFFELIRDSFLIFFIKILAVFLGFLSSIFIAKYYGAEILGVVALYTSLATSLTILGTMGLNVSIMKFIPQNKNSAISIYKQNLLIITVSSLVLSLIIYILSDKIANLIFTNKQYFKYVEYIAFTLIFFILNELSISTLRALNKTNSFLFFTLLPSALRLFLLITLSALIVDKDVPIYVFFIIPIVGSILIIGVILKKSSQWLNKSEIKYKTILYTSIPMLMTGVLDLVIMNSDTIMLGIYTNESLTGIYNIAFMIAMLPNMILFSIRSFAGTKFAEYFHKGKHDELRIFTKKTTKFAFYSTLPLVLLIIAFGRWILGYYGDEFLLGYYALVILVFSELVKAGSGFVGFFLDMTGYQKSFGVIMLIAALLNILINIILIPQYGINGAAIGSLIATVFWNMTTSIYIYYKFNYTISYIPSINLQTFIFNLGKDK